MIRVYLLAVVCAVMLSAFACNRNDTPTALTDADLKNALESKLASDPQLSATNLSVTVDAGRNSATISGIVESEDLRRKALDLARTAHSEVVIEDAIEVKPRELTRAEFTAEHARLERTAAKERKERIGSSIDDAWIHLTIVTKLIGNAKTPEHTINVDVTNAVVRLRGTVGSADERVEAERIAKETAGVKRVSNLLKLAKTS